MNIPQAKLVSKQSVENLLATATNGKFSLSYLAKKHQMQIEKDGVWLAKIYLPWMLDWNESLGLREKPDSHYSMILIRAGQAVAGYFHLGKLIDHKVFRAYMVRQKQGVSQIKHLKTKGKSRAGSRVRLAESERFFEEINERLTSYANRFPMDFWGISCAKTMWPFYFSSEVSPPFSQKEENLIELPVHISQASFEELVQVGELVQRFHLIFSERGKEIFGELTLGESETTNDDNW
ncbi:hypothetical protein GCM10009119_00200 [Algoriphagus jejuensis]|uniref:VLRF1 domain-containing protein n=1 Tax=Algoriphagus jejuensis TaxID=419934 RepID=A0ABN1MVW0_9BACT